MKLGKATVSDASSSIPARLPHWLRRYPVLLATMVSSLNRLSRLAGTRKRRLLGSVALALVATLAWMIIAAEATALVITQGLNHPAIVVSAAALYTATFIPRRWRSVIAANANSWLVATPRVRKARGTKLFAAVLASLLSRWVYAGFLALLASLNVAITIGQSLTLLGFFTAGSAAGALVGWSLAIRGDTRRREGSRYSRRMKRIDASAKSSSAALSRWPVAQALAWARPENTRLLLAVAILTVPSGVGPVAALGMLASWAVISYLAALLLAVPRVGRAASEWLRSTPITFWAFAWPLARRTLLHQLLGTLVGVAVLLMVGAEPATAFYGGTVWLALVALVTAVSLADCYRARSPVAKITLSALAVLLIEQRLRGWGISLAILVTALHMRKGVRHART
jgi:hypothetical protein